MHYIERDTTGRIIRVEDEPFTGATEQSADLTPDIGQWYKKQEARAATLLQLRQSDLEMVRVLEDLIEVLMSKGVISITDLPPAAQTKLINRAQARRTLSGLEGLIADEDENLI
ncbi:tryptophan synthase subunit beta [Superficieibacter electus]|uniref:Tryptophan synthase subunit beta n=1 Tax=Superficieibacter electus TaxID=2022662 RepID=A0A2P5GM10_9ENTR|nr:tryptophan synthase subunit beta [Superficieibacter electus]POP40865.1 tryptophan synthase subunit beta [Superficieibacter electus]POP46578.1 tryptophan synthase subunit beta [Superficieibacter electus]